MCASVHLGKGVTREFIVIHQKKGQFHTSERLPELKILWNTGFSSQFRNIVGIHARMPETHLLKRLKNERVPCKDAMVTEKGVSWVSGEVFLACWEVWSDVKFRP